MLTRLSVENYALIERLELELGRSLNIITGETGAGKSILLGALGLIMGNRADTSTLKDNTRNCVIEGTFDISGYGLEAFFEENDIEYEPATVIRRVINPAGKSRAYVNDLPIQLSVLKELSSKLIDIHSQHQNLMLGDENFRTRIVDSIASSEPILEKYRSLYAAFRSATSELTKLREEAEQNKRDEEYLRYQYDQIAALNLYEGEQEVLEAEQKELANAEQIQSVLGQADHSFEDDETGILPQLKAIEQGLKTISEVYPRGSELAERVRGSMIEIKDIGSELSTEAERIEHNPARLTAVDDRLNTIWSLLQKHHLATGDELIALGKELSAKLEVISNSDEAISDLEQKVATVKAEAIEEAKKITAARKKAATELENDIVLTLERLGMPSSRFICELTPLAGLSPTGADEIKFLFSANKDIAPQPLEKVASGGEISRVMLTLKSLVARSSMLPTIIFDEIDTGVSGRIADATGEIIAELGEHMQVINITHLPQVASKGDTHLFVYKEETASGTKTLIRRLTPEERVTEIAKMLSGSHITDAALQQARTLLG